MNFFDLDFTIVANERNCVHIGSLGHYHIKGIGALPVIIQCPLCGTPWILLKNTTRAATVEEVREHWTPEFQEIANFLMRAYGYPTTEQWEKIAKDPNARPPEPML